jgi:hypothetical protein
MWRSVLSYVLIRDRSAEAPKTLSKGPKGSNDSTPTKKKPSKGKKELNRLSRNGVEPSTSAVSH